ncbi:MAG: hypothetical protein KatS3mg023_1813 [Armatimonadota bacterium]|nr:MAG: hypothetical protein KatS3mg023_1813 [Armatimonadota bacterium]
MKNNALFITQREASERLGVSTQTVNQWVRQGRLPSVRWGRVRRIPAAAIEAFQQELLEIALSQPRQNVK